MSVEWSNSDDGYEFNLSKHNEYVCAHSVHKEFAPVWSVNEFI